MKIPDKIDGFEVHPPLDAILEEKQPPLQLPPQAVYTELLKDPILNALADNLQGIRDAEQLRANQATLTVAVQQAASNQGISQDQLEQILRRVSDHHGEDLAQRLLARLGPGPPPPPAVLPTHPRPLLESHPPASVQKPRTGGPRGT
jgi:hypothetical protein